MDSIKDTTSVLDYLVELENKFNLGPKFGSAYAVGVQAAFASIMNIMTSGKTDEEQQRLMNVILEDSASILAMATSSDKSKEEVQKDKVQKEILRSIHPLSNSIN